MPGQVTSCRICGCTDLRPVLDLGHLPPVDNFRTEEQLSEPETHYPLRTVICEDCNLVQLDYVVPPGELFHEDYAYDMSVTSAGVEHFRGMASELDATYPDHDSVVDVGSNTGVLLEAFAEHGWDILGVEPSANVRRMAVERGIPTRNEFFDGATAEAIRSEDGPKDLVTATNVLAHVEDLHDAVEGVKTLLADDGVFVFEVPYLVDLVRNNEFDTIYHEHLSYFSVEPLVRLFDRFDVEIIDVEKQSIHGGSIRVHVAREGAYEPTDAAGRFRDREREAGVHTEQVLDDYERRVERNRRELVEMVLEFTTGGATVAGVGAPAKGVTLLNYCNFDDTVVPYVSEKAELKIGKYVPGTHNEVVTDEVLIEEVPDYALLLPWNFADSVMDNLEAYRERGGRFVVPVPEPHVVE